MSKTAKLWTKEYIFLMIANFFLFFGDNLLLPVIPVYAKELGANTVQIGLVTASFFVTSILMRMFTEGTSRRLGRKTLLLVSVTIFALVMLGYYLSAGILMILLLRLAQGLSFGASTTLYGSAAADIIPLKKMGEGIGYFGLGMTIAAALGPFLGAAAVSLPNYKWVFLVSVLLIVTAIPMTFQLTLDNRKKRIKKKKNFKSFLSDFIELKSVYPSLFIFFIGLSMSGIYTYIVLFGQEMNIGKISFYFLVLSGAEFVIRLFCGRLYDRKGIYFVVIPGAIAGIVSCILLAKTTNFGTLCLSAAFCGIAYGMILPAMQAVAITRAEPERRVSANATIYNFLDIGMALGPVLFGAAIQQWGYQRSFLFSGIIFLIIILILVVTPLAKAKDSCAEIRLIHLAPPYAIKNAFDFNMHLRKAPDNQSYLII